MLDLMESRAVTPSQRMYTIAINSCGAKVWRALQYLDAMIGNEVRPNAVSKVPPNRNLLLVNDSRFSLAQQITYSCVINVCKNAKRWREAKKLIAEMRECAIAPNEVCFANAIHACARAGEWTEALALLDVMRADPNVPDPNVVCYTAAIGACGKALEWQSILDVSSSRKVCKRLLPWPFQLRLPRFSSWTARCVLLLCMMSHICFWAHSTTYSTNQASG